MTRRYQHSPQYLRAHAKRVERKRAEREAKAKEQKTYYVYILRRKGYCKYYIGCTSNIHQRIKLLLRGAPSSAISKAIREHGEDAFEKIVLYETRDKQDASLFAIAQIASGNKDYLYNSEVHIPYARNSSTPRTRQICICPECGASHTRKKGSNVE